MSSGYRKNYVRLSGSTGYYEAEGRAAEAGNNTQRRPKTKHLLFGTERSKQDQDSPCYIKGYN